MDNYIILKEMDKNGRITFPVELRKLYGLSPNSKVLLLLKEDGILISAMPNETK